MKHFTSKHQKIGEIGENYACEILKKDGFSIQERNFTIREGEVDIIAKKDSNVYFIEVKTARLSSSIFPSENIHPKKLRRFRVAVFEYCRKESISFSRLKMLGLLVYLNADSTLNKYEYVDLVL